MKTNCGLFNFVRGLPRGAACMVAAVSLLFEVTASSGETTNTFLYTGSLTNITLAPGTYDITAYGAQGGQGYTVYFYGGGGVFIGGASLGAEMQARFSFPTQTTLTLLVGAAGTNGGEIFNHGGGGGGGGSFVVNGTTPLLIAGGGGGAGGGNGGYGSGYNGNIGNAGGSGAGGYPSYGGGGGSNGSGGGSPAQESGGGGGGGFIGDGGGDGSNLRGIGGSAFLNGGAGGAPIDGSGYLGYQSGAGGYGGGGSGGDPISDTAGFGGGGGGGYSGGGGGSGQDAAYIGAGGGGGSFVDASAVAILTEISGVVSPDDPFNGEIIISTAPSPPTITLPTITAGQFGFTIRGPTNATIVVQACTNLGNPVWIPLATNILSNGTNYFSDPQSMNGPSRFYRVNQR